MRDPDNVPDADDASATRGNTMNRPQIETRQPFVSKAPDTARKRMTAKSNKQQYAEMLRDMNRPTAECVPDREPDTPVGIFR